MNNSDSQSKFKQRKSERFKTELRTIVQVKDDCESIWKDVTIVTTVSRNGAGFSLSRECTVGRLIMLVLPLAKELRAYDHDERLYPTMGIVQNCYKATTGNEEIYHVGVGFIGKEIPDSYNTDPKQSYRIAGMRDNGLWKVVETAAPFKQRKNARYWQSLEVTISLIQRERKSISKEVTTTKDICATGASVYCSLDAKVGDRVKFGCKEHDFYAIAVVRNVKGSKSHAPTLHLEFVENRFPIEKLTFAIPVPQPDLTTSAAEVPADEVQAADVQATDVQAAEVQSDQSPDESVVPPEAQSMEITQFEFTQY